MTMEETQKIIAVIDATYPNFKVKDATIMLTAWYGILKEYEYKDISSALTIYIKTDDSNFPPSVSKLISMLNVADKFSYPSETEAWGMVRKAISSLSWDNPKAEFDKLPAIVQRAVGNPARLKEWAMLDTSEVDTVESSNFLRSYRSAVTQEQEYKKMPQEVRDRIESMRTQMLEVHDD